MRNIFRLKTIIMLFAFSLFAFGCGSSQTEDISEYITPIEDICVNDQVKIIGLGEATHGNVEFQELKKDVFEALLKNNNCKVFAIEGDFGGGLKVNEYIHGGAGTAKEAVSQIGFAIYRTKQMEDLVQWMRNYNDSASTQEQISFYGFDMQRYDNSKEYLFEYLKQAGCLEYENYQKQLQDLNDDTVYDQKKSVIKDAQQHASEIKQDLESNKEVYLSKTDEKSYQIACESVKAIIENTELQLTSTQYGELRDQYMKERVDWIYQFEGKQKIFLASHDGHIEKSGAVKSYTGMGKRLAEEYGEGYFAIGTDLLEGDVTANTSSGVRKSTHIQNKNKLTALIENESENSYYLDFHKMEQNEALKKTINTKQNMVNIGDQFDFYQKYIKKFYTLKMKPAKAYDSLIIVKQVTPTSIWNIGE